MKLAILMNRIKQDQVFPKCMEVCNISGIWKRKGPMNEFDLYSKSILDRLINNDKYDTLDENLTDCNVGGRKEKT